MRLNTIGTTIGVVLCSWLLLGQVAGTRCLAQSNDSAVTKAKLIDSAQRAIELAEKSSAEYLKQRECFSCHHQAMSIMALMKARSHGLKIDMQNLQAQVDRTLEHLKRGQADYSQGKGQGGGVDTAGYALSALDAAGLAPNETTAAVVHYLLQVHSEKRHWACSSNRPPTESSDISTTAVALRGLAAFHDSRSAVETTDDKSAQLTKRVTDCDQWLARHEPKDTEERVFKIFALKTRERLNQSAAQTENAQPTSDAFAELQQALLKTQNADGGWAQMPEQTDAKSDAYATATALNALIVSGLGSNQAAYERGLKYLLDTQQTDGSWHVVTRSKPIQKYFESGFPHGVDQFISMQATCWSIMAIAHALPASPDESLPALPWLEPAKTAKLAQEVPSTVAVKEPTAEQLDFFEREVRPVLVENCLSCHGPDDQSGELRVDSLASLLKGGESGPALIPHAVERSLMIKAVRRQDELKMPPEAPLSSINVERLERWIEMGAPWPKNLDANELDKRRAAVKSHWAFQSPQRHPVPEVSDPAWSRTAIDRFIAVNLEKHNLAPNRSAGRRELLRRLSYDLVGLPPTAEEVDQFVADERPDAIERVIDRLLASPKFGQHWGRHWLDVARYSDTKGYVYAREERFFVQAPAYRDWVVRSLADDMSYSRFVQLQVAADQIAPNDADAQAAMGFLTMGRRFLGVTHDIIDDRIDVVSRGLLGLTVGCARCHDHKFDPIPTADYYSLYGVFQNSIERRVRIPDQRSEDQRQGFEEEYVKRQQKYQEQLAAEKKTANERVLARLGDYLKAQLELEKYPAEGFDVVIQKDDLVPAQLRRVQAYMLEAAVRKDAIFEAWRLFAAIPASEFSREAANVTAQVQSLPPERLNRLITKQFRQPPASMQQVAEIYGNLLGRLDLVICESEADRQALQELKQVVQSDNSPFRVPDEDIVSTEQFFESRVCEALWKLQGDVDRWIIQNGDAPSYATVLVDRSAIREPYVFRRGNPLQIAQRVPRQFLSVLCAPSTTASQEVGRVSRPVSDNVGRVSRPVSDNVGRVSRPVSDNVGRVSRPVSDNVGRVSRPVSVDVERVSSPAINERLPHRPFEHGSGRRELAEAIADSRNPLTARVWVNRLWQHLLGQGLVSTPSDFGLRATPPSHPELLDNLALDLMEHDYSTKHIIRQIVSSSAYQQSSKAEDEVGVRLFAKANEVDPDNRWLWRSHARRLTFEQQRDTWLMASGQLDLRFGGRAKQLFSEGLNARRTLYGLVDRQFLSGVLRIFDFANPDLHIPQRSETTVPQQALFELNHDFTATVARNLASHVQRNHGTAADTEKVAAMFRYALGRQATHEEITDAIEFLLQAPSAIPKPREEAKDWKYGFGKFNSNINALEGFQELPHFTGSAWQGGAKWPDEKLGWVQLTATGGHAGNDLEHAAVRRWIAPTDGTLNIRSQVVHNVPAGDGIRALVLHSTSQGNKLLKNEVVHNAQVEFNFDQINVAKGDTVDFIVNFQANLNNDQFLWSPELQSQDKSWSAERDFGGKQPNYLNPWEQLAQVLLLSNELVYLD